VTRAEPREAAVKAALRRTRSAGAVRRARLLPTAYCLLPT